MNDKFFERIPQSIGGVTDETHGSGFPSGQYDAIDILGQQLMRRAYLNGGYGNGGKRRREDAAAGFDGALMFFEGALEGEDAYGY